MLHLLALIALASTARAMAEPSCTTAVCVYDDPSATPAITSYPTTLTFSSTWSTVRTVTPDNDGNDASGATAALLLPQTTTEYQYAITYEPHKAAPTSFPATVLQSVTTRHTCVWTAPPSLSLSSSGASGNRTSSTTDEPTSSQWIVHRPAATDLPRRSLGTTTHNNATHNATTTPAGWSPAQQCVDAGQQTGCVRQCTQCDGLWYCFDKHAWYEENVMGRVCWWTQPDNDDSGGASGAMVTQYLMLAEPCIAGDLHVNCEACRLYG
ncbi:hypothetical protein SCUCBS95973_002017 [Sporothrix curviconia]|uniref:Uncharacterized protein n=1 Tax=Sporothrix curviconia TaxID=1260050 RepID=A0ABP0B3D9_9PEZI